MTYAYDALIDAVAAIERVEWSGVFRFDSDGMVEGITGNVSPYSDIPHAPDHVEADEDSDILIDGGMSEWQPLTGLTRQDSYRGAVLHTSEVLSPGIVTAMREMGDALVWTIVPVEAGTHGPDDHTPGCDVPFGVCDTDSDAPAGWAILFADDPTRRMRYWEAEDAYQEMLDECHEPVDVCGYFYGAGRLLRMADPVAFRCGVADWADSEGIEIV